LLLRVDVGVVTLIVPVVAPMGTVAVISVGESTVNDAEIPLKVTLVAPERSVPRMTMVDPAVPGLNTVLTKGASPRETR
jgi:hypothetical protein